jgi:arylsulfatase A-like enzyme
MFFKDKGGKLNMARNNINRREFMGAAIAASALTTTAGLFAQRTPVPARPNILFILADDMGYGDLSCYGRPEYQTPVLDQLAKDGVRFTDAYASGPVCTVTRVGFHTGRYPHRLAVGAGGVLEADNEVLGIPPEQPMLAERLRGNDYENILIGKWHIGRARQFRPNQRGYDEYFGFLSGTADYFSYRNTAGMVDLWENEERSRAQGYTTDLFTERALRVIRRPHTKPFYISLHYNAPHSPWEGPGDGSLDHTHDVQQGPVGSVEKYGEMVKSMDDGIGRVLQALRDANLERNTFVIFTSDNGGIRYSRNWPFSFQKGSCWEGGIRVPAILRWPGVIQPGQVTSQAATSIDWTATILAATGTKPDPNYPLDGEDMLPVCTGDRPVYDRTLFWRNNAHDAVRSGQWKYLREQAGEHLFNLTADPGEKSDLKDQQPEIFASLRNKFKDWNSRMQPVRE